MSRSIVDDLTEKLAPVYRQLNDLNVNTLLGVKCDVLRITKTIPDVMGETQESVRISVISNAIISYPFANSLQIFESYNDIINKVESNSVDLWDFLPIKMKIPFNSSPVDSASEIKRGDMIIHILYDNNNHKLPLIMSVEKVFGAFLVKHQVGRNYELTLYRGILSSTIQTALDEFIAQS